MGLKIEKTCFGFKGHSDSVNSVLISQDNKTGSSDFSVKAWNLKTFELKLTLEFSFSALRLRLISADEVLILGSYGVFAFYDLKSKIRNELRTNYSECISCIQFEENEEHYFLGYFCGNIQIWVASTLIKVFEAKKTKELLPKLKLSLN